MKAETKVLNDIHQEPLQKDDEGYIDGYVQGADNRPYAVVIIPETRCIGLCPIHSLEYITSRTN